MDLFAYPFLMKMGHGTGFLSNTSDYESEGRAFESLWVHHFKFTKKSTVEKQRELPVVLEGYVELAEDRLLQLKHEKVSLCSNSLRNCGLADF